MEEDCLFCKIIAREIPAHQVYEDNDFIAFLDIKPVNLGHLLLVPKAHNRNIFDLPESTLGKLGPILQKLARSIRTATEADGINIMWNNESAAGQVVFHAHIHIIPRFEGDGYEHWHGTEHSEEELREVKENIISNLR